MEVKFYRDGKGLKERQWAFEPLLFHSCKFLENQFPEGGYVSFTLEREEAVHAVIHFVVSDRGWVSLSKSPFGGVGAGSVGQSDLLSLTEKVVEEAGQTSVTILLPFADYPGTANTLLEKCLRVAGFKTVFRYLHHYIEIESDLTEGMHISQKRRLNKCVKLGYVFRQEPQACMEEVYRFIIACRLEQGIPINMSLEHLVKSADALPGAYKIFSVRDNGHLIAACITVDISAKVLYYFLPAASREYASSSPMVLLIYQLYNWALYHNYLILDLGKTSVDGIKQSGLANFKEKMGGAAGEGICLVR